MPLILAAYGEPNGIVETGLAVGAADVLILRQPTETLLFALHKAAVAPVATETGKVVTVFSPKGGSGKIRAGHEPRCAAAARSGQRTLPSTSTCSSATPRRRSPLALGRRSPISPLRAVRWTARSCSR